MRVTTNESKIPRYVAFSFVLLVLAIVIALTARGLFSAMRVANEIDEKILQDTNPRINQEQLDRAFNNLNTKTAPPLD